MDAIQKEAKEKELLDAMMQRLPNVLLIQGYMEHQLDLMGKLIVDIYEQVGEENLSPEVKGRLDSLRMIMEASSVDFDNIKDPMEAYKYPKAKGVKDQIRVEQARYLKAKVKFGIF